MGLFIFRLPLNVWQRKKNTLFYHFLRIRLSSIRLKRCGRILNGRYGKLRRDTLACWKCYWVFLILFNYKYGYGGFCPRRRFVA